MREAVQSSRKIKIYPSKEMLVKRIVYKHKNHLFAINGGAYRNELNRTRSAPPDREKGREDLSEVVIENKNKALALETSDGRVLTKEMLENFVDSSEEEEIISEKEQDTSEKGLQAGEDDAEKVLQDQVSKKREGVQEKEPVSQSAFEGHKDIYFEDDLDASQQEAVEEGEIVGDDSSFYVPPAAFATKREHESDLPLQENAFKEHIRVYATRDILEWQGRKKVNIIYDKSIFSRASGVSKIGKLEPKSYDVVSTFRLELNRAAKSTIEGVLSSIRNLRVKTEDEMVEMSTILFEKAIFESSYLIIYIYIIKDLYKTFQCEDEKKKNPKNTVFFTTLCHLCKETFKNRESWSHSTDKRDLRNLSRQERAQYEDEYEEKETIKLKKKGRILGCMRLLGSMYCQSMISDMFVLVVLRDLFKKINDLENIEIICVLLGCCGEKLNKRHGQEIAEVLKELKDVSLVTDKRTKFLILDFFDNVVPKWKKSLSKPNIGQNTFHGMVIEEEEHIEPAEKDIGHHISILMEDLLSIEYNPTKLRENVNSLIAKHSLKEFVDAFLGNIVENFGNVQIKILAFNDIGRSISQDVISQALLYISSYLVDLCRDAPYAADNFYKMLCYLRSDGLISKETFYQFNNDNFEAERKKIIIEWLGDYENSVRIDRITEKDEIRKILCDLEKDANSGKYQNYIEKYGT